MAIPLSNQALQETLLRAVVSFSEGAARQDLQRAAGLEGVDVQRIRRALQALVAAGQLRPEGHTRARRYVLTHVKDPAAAPAPGSEGQAEGLGEKDSEALLSAEGRALRVQVRQPLMHRAPAGYRRAFLDAYRPNQTFYLDESVREHLRSLGTPGSAERPAGTYAREILQRLLIDLSWNSSRLEGNTYSLLDTERLLQKGEVALGKDAPETQMILNHKAAIEFLVEGVEEAGFEPHTIRNLHALLSDNLLGDPADGGRLRRGPVGIHGTSFLPLEVPQLIEECFLQILHTATAIADPFEQSFFILAHLPYLQPFIDVNKRTARLAANLPFIQHNLCPLSFVDVPVELYTEGLLAVYELNRVELLRDVFEWAYARSAARYQALRASMGEPDPFKLRYRAALKEVVAHVVRHAVDRRTGEEQIHRYAQEMIAEGDRGRFRAVAEAELSALHEGNFARYRLKPSEFKAWQARWGIE